ncbi:ribonuclease H-like domain-containing protein [Tanacetum coccineum]
MPQSYFHQDVNKVYIVGLDDDKRKQLLVIYKEAILHHWECHVKTKSFKVVAYDLESGNLSEVKDFGRKTLFLGFSSSFWTEDTTGVIKGNCIYYTDDVLLRYNHSEYTDMEIYHLSDGTIEPHFAGESSLDVTPPIWLQPINSELISSLDAGNPLHLQTNDNSSGPLVNVKLTGCENYRVWANAMKIALQARNKMCFVDGTCVKTAYVTSPALSNQWDRCNAVVLSWLLSSISEDLYLKINNFNQTGLPVSKYYHKLNSLWREFDMLTKFSPCTCNARNESGKHQQLMKLMQFLMGLDDVYQPTRSSLLTQPELPDVKDAFVIVCREESHRGLGSTSGVLKPSCQNVVMKGNYHHLERCFELIGYPPGFKKNSNGNSGNNNKRGFSNNNNRGGSSNNVEVQTQNGPLPFTTDQISKLMSLIGEKENSGVHANMAGINFSFFNANVFFNNHFYKFFNANIKVNDVNLNFGWIIDSGANQHITNSTKNMTNVIDISDLNITVGHPNGTIAKINHVGNLRLTNNVVLFDVLVIPEYTVSLLSVNKMIKDSKLHVGFNEYDCVIQDLREETVLGTGSESGGLYVFDIDCGEGGEGGNRRGCPSSWSGVCFDRGGVSTVAQKDTDISLLDSRATYLKSALDDSKAACAKAGSLITSLTSERDRLTSEFNSTLHTAFQDFKEKAEAQQEEQAQVLYNRVAELEAHVMDVSGRLEGEFYPAYLTTLAGRRWFLTHGIQLAVLKCFKSPEYQGILVALGRAVDFGMQEGLEAGYEHGVAGTPLSAVEAYNPEAARTSYFDAVRALEDVDFPLVNLLKSKKDAGMDEVLDCFILDGPLADLPEAAHLQPCLEQLSVPIHHSDDKAIVRETSLSFALLNVHLVLKEAKKHASVPSPAMMEIRLYNPPAFLRLGWVKQNYVCGSSLCPRFL